MQITLKQPDDWHLHLRDDAMLKAVVASSAQTTNRSCCTARTCAAISGRVVWARATPSMLPNSSTSP